MEFETHDRDELSLKVREILAEALHRDSAAIALDDRLVEDLGAESVDLITMVFELEDTFGLSVADEDLKSLVSVRAVVDYILASRPQAAEAT
ncbi:MAG TPA: acyl carrier protein [Thermoanaerobaculia bacterium]|nr:acyl carrier protein [Thermoanaerobaculia bacterium]